MWILDRLEIALPRANLMFGSIAEDGSLQLGRLGTEDSITRRGHDSSHQARRLRRSPSARTLDAAAPTAQGAASRSRQCSPASTKRLRPCSGSRTRGAQQCVAQRVRPKLLGLQGGLVVDADHTQVWLADPQGAASGSGGLSLRPVWQHTATHRTRSPCGAVGPATAVVLLYIVHA